MGSPWYNPLQVSTPALRFDQASRVYPSPGGTDRVALRAVSLEIAAGEVVAVVGRSGSGKSTFLHLAAAIDLPSTGRVEVGGQDTACLSDAARTALRRDQVGLIFQFFHLLPHLSVAENVALPETIAGGRRAAVMPRVMDLLDAVQLADRAEEAVTKLSGGEQQRVAICRALLRRPPLLLADEPTGNLDDATGQAVYGRMLELVRAQGATLVTVTHSREVAAKADRVLTLHSGELAPG